MDEFVEAVTGIVDTRAEVTRVKITRVKITRVKITREGFNEGDPRHESIEARGEVVRSNNGHRR
ncbi:hypothetical protein PCCS19_24670 [Paenibacillus sp. CCS19]|nr:hypothetical protein PCCS19_24670 [Paenibacillus cellulosilyticus]